MNHDYYYADIHQDDPDHLLVPVCRDCGALIHDKDRHHNWHRHWELDAHKHCQTDRATPADVLAEIRRANDLRPR